MTETPQSIATIEPRPKLSNLPVIILALATPLVMAFLDPYFDKWFDRNGSVFAGLMTLWVVVVIVLLFMRSEPRSESTEFNVWREIGFKPTKLRETLIILIIGFLLLFFCTAAFVILSRTIFPTEIKANGAVSLPWPLIILAYLTGSVGEEILFRGYALERLYRMTNNWWIAGGITYAVFVGLHIPAYPLAHIVGYIAPSALVITLVYIWKRNLAYTVMIHGALNLPILLAAILLPLVQK